MVSITFTVAMVLQCNKKRIVDYPNLWGYLRDLYQTKGFGDTTNRFHIEHHYQVAISSADSKMYRVPRATIMGGWLLASGMVISMLLLKVELKVSAILKLTP